jgi:uncharacterized membrane protein YgdD (TMEM256/DUF423 family)
MKSFPRYRIALAALNGFLAIAGGAFGAHAMSDPRLKALLQTAAQYELASAAVGLGVLALAVQGMKGARLSATLILVGGLIFGASIDLIVITGQNLFGAVTPIGGLAMLAGFGWLAISALRR